MLWQVERDFRSLFSRGKGNESHLDAIDGLRSIANLSIIFLHLTVIFSTFVSVYPHEDWQEYLRSAAFALNTILTLTLEIFFLLSSFLLTWKLIIQWNKNLPHLKLFLLQEYPLSILKRALRFWPGLFLSTLISLIFGEAPYPNSTYFFQLFRHLSTWMFFQNYIDMEYWYGTYIPLWSISLDMQMHIILPLLLYLFYRMRNSFSMNKSFFLLLLVSIIRGMIVFNPLTMSVLSEIYRYPAFPLLSPDHLVDWVERKYNLTFPFRFPNSNPGKVFLQQMYLPFQARFGAFIIGSMLAIQLNNTFQCNQMTRPKSWKKICLFILISMHLLTLLQSPVMPETPPEFVLKFLVASCRQLFTIGQALILFSAVCPRWHTYHSARIRKFLSLPMWIPISKLSYLCYLIHWKISFQLIFAGPLNFLKDYSVTYASLISLPIILFIVESLSSVWFVLVEKPIERAIERYFQKKHFN